MTATAPRLEIPPNLQTLVRIDTAESIDAPGFASAASRVLTRDGTEAEMWTGHPGSTALGAIWRRLGWLQGRIAARRPLGFDCEGYVEWLVTEPLHGKRATEVEYVVDAVRTVGLIGAALAELHAVPAERCPFVLDSTALARAAVSRLEQLPDEARIDDPAFGHMPPSRLVSIIEDGVDRFARTDDPVLCHGRPTVGSFVLRRAEPAGFDGWEHCGVGDRHHDLAVLARNVATLMTPHLVPVLFDGYGLDRPDLARLDWFQLIDSVS